ncbi:MAG: hypothetical protein KDK66_01585 [Deltaproteobacteria bacterium]|nr:hypothetical protein [Deltaproteobacteria bacterium]
MESIKKLWGKGALLGLLGLWFLLKQSLLVKASPWSEGLGLWAMAFALLGLLLYFYQFLRPS